MKYLEVKAEHLLLAFECKMCPDMLATGKMMTKI